VFRRLVTLSSLVVAALVLLGGEPASAELPPGGTFIDDDGNTHEGAIEAIFAEGITVGCDSRGIKFCPSDIVTRGQMAAFLDRALGLDPATTDHFSDDNRSIFESNINRLAEAGITRGCNPPDNDRFCPDSGITRAEMATMLARAFPELMPDEAPEAFEDDNSSVHQENINKIAAAGITRGCNPPDNTHYCPNDQVTRSQMASFLIRALGLSPITPPPRPPMERVSSFTTYFSCCENRVTNIRLLAREVNGYVVMPGETYSIERVVGPRTADKGYLPAPYLVGGQSACCAIGGGVSQFATTIFNAIFWGGYEVGTFRPHSGWIARYPLGIEHTLSWGSIDFRFTNDTINPVEIRTSSTGTSVTVELWGNQGGWRVRGDHKIGNRNPSISVLSQGGSNAKRVSAQVTGSAPGQVKVVRTLTQGGSSTSQTWFWNYVS
jgi:hypothetical protein